MKKALRPYQKHALDTIVAEFKKRNRQICVLPTGAGKTLIFINLIERLKLRTLIIAHTKDLLNQIKKRIETDLPEKSCALFNKKRKNDQEIIICSVQSAAKDENIALLSECNFDLLIIDECHRACAKNYRKIIQELRFSEKKLIGFTATPYRTDKDSLFDIFGHISYSAPLIDLIKEGYLVDFIGFRIKTNVVIPKIAKHRGDFSVSKLDAVVNVKNRNQLIADEYVKLANREKAIVFCTSVNHAIEIKKEFLSRGIPCEFIYGGTNDERRKEILSSFQQGKIKVLANCNLLTEGFDEPSVTTLLMARPTCSKTLYVQMIGRGARLFKNKSHCKVIEFTDNNFDVCSLEDLIEKPIKKRNFLNGESFKNFSERVEKEKLIGQGTVVEAHSLTKREKFYQNMATDWQREELSRRNIEFKEPLLEITANYLLRS